MSIVETFSKAAQQAPEASRIYCDCDGTLFQTKKNGLFNENLFKFLIELKKAGHDVIIFSAESASNEGRVKLYSKKLTGDPEFFDDDGLIITPKEMVAGEKAFLVIDDNHSTHGVKAEHKWDPDNEELIADLAKMLAEPEAIKNLPRAPGLGR